MNPDRTTVKMQEALAGGRVLWSRAEGAGSRLATAWYGDPAPDDLGSFGSLGPLAGGGSTLAYADGGQVTALGGPGCSSPNAAIASRIASRALIPSISGGSPTALLPWMTPSW